MTALFELLSNEANHGVMDIVLGQLQDWLSPGTGNLLERLKDMDDTDAVAREIYASVLTRTPSVTEVNDIHTYLTETPEDNRVSALKEIVWALLTSTEFRFHY